MRRPCRLDVGETPEQFAKHHGDLSSREVRAQTEMRAWATKSDMWVRCSCDVEPERIREHLRITVRRNVEHAELLTFGDLSSRQFAVASGRTPHVGDGAGEAHDFLHRV